MQVSCPYDCNVFLRGKKEGAASYVALSFLEVPEYQYFYWHIKMAPLYSILQLLKLLLYTIHIYFFQTNSRQKKNIIVIHFEIQYKSLLFYLKEQINLQH